MLISDPFEGDFDVCFGDPQISLADVHFFDLFTHAVLGFLELVELHIDLANERVLYHFIVPAGPEQHENAALLDELGGVASRAQRR